MSLNKKIMIKNKIAIIVCLIVLIACSKEEIVDLSSKENIDAIIESQMKQYNIPGIAYCAVKDDSVVYSGAKGLANKAENRPFTLDARMVIGSTSKIIVVTSIMQLYEKGLVNLDDDINSFLPFKVINPDYPNDVITIEMLLTHTSSITDDGWYYSIFYLFGYVDYPQPLGEFCEDYLVKGRQYYAENNFRNIKPGSKYIYSNVAIGLLGYIVGQIDGTDYNTYCKENIFNPLGMKKTTWFYSETPKEEVAVPYLNTYGKTPNSSFSCYPDYPNGHLITTVNDMSVLLRTYIMNGTYNGVQLLKPETVDLILQNRVESEFEQQGLIFYANTIGGRLLWGHTGGDPGAESFLYFDRENKTGYFYFYNRSSDTWTLILGEALINYANSL